MHDEFFISKRMGLSETNIPIPIPIHVPIKEERGATL